MHGNEMSTGPWEKLLCISGNLESHSHVQGCAHAQGRPEKALITHLYFTLCKLEAKLKAEWLTAGALVCCNTYSQRFGKDWETSWFEAFKEISVWPSVNSAEIGCSSGNQITFTLMGFSSSLVVVVLLMEFVCFSTFLEKICKTCILCCRYRRRKKTRYRE